MDDIEKTRNNLVIPGYVHPSTPYSGSREEKVYKTFNNENKEDNDFGSVSTVEKKYATFSSNDEHLYTCPQCGQKALSIGKDDYKECVCKNRHRWYQDLNGFIIKGRAPN